MKVVYKEPLVLVVIIGQSLYSWSTQEVLGTFRFFQLELVQKNCFIMREDLVCLYVQYGHQNEIIL